ncbi:MAG: PEP-CTERM sorting domain-containing protein [Candidatus Omnitrophota bacterium]|nr:PEP-CTERM sorting domain-containing protein [Candidatus Omnitrophota bacterium]
MINIGPLLNGQTTTTFAFGASLIADLAADGLLTVNIVELSAGTDRFTINTSILSGNFACVTNCGGSNGGGNTSVPEPMTGALVASGIGLSALIRRRFKQTK